MAQTGRLQAALHAARPWGVDEIHFHRRMERLNCKLLEDALEPAYKSAAWGEAALGLKLP